MFRIARRNTQAAQPDDRGELGCGRKFSAYPHVVSVYLPDQAVVLTKELRQHHLFAELLLSAFQMRMGIGIEREASVDPEGDDHCRNAVATSER
ncbi:hypothetical protein [uncultured Paracoccus sp.]|uniref:hypothetical protein n=1 Tax=uncultured Paracoccus sp. TaxID=189685 RepID=UPI002610CCA4|nr:hypothetical protein [uncultured Paracoccus sp.]